MVWYGMVRYGMVWYSMVWYGMVWYGKVWYGMVWYGMVWYGMVRYGMVWPFFFLFFQSTHKRVCLLKRPQHLTAKVIKLSKNILFLFPLLMKFFLVLDHFTRDTFDTLSSHRIGWIRRTKSKTASIFKTENAKCRIFFT